MYANVVNEEYDMNIAYTSEHVIGSNIQSFNVNKQFSENLRIKNI